MKNNSIFLLPEASHCLVKKKGGDGEIGGGREVHDTITWAGSLFAAQLQGNDRKSRYKRDKKVPRLEGRAVILSADFKMLSCPLILERRSGDCHYHSSQLWPSTEGAPGPPRTWKAADAAPRGVPQQGGHSAWPQAQTSGPDHGDGVGRAAQGSGREVAPLLLPAHLTCSSRVSWLLFLRCQVPSLLFSGGHTASRSLSTLCGLPVP